MRSAAKDGVPVYILAGGQSSRFGTDKARVVWQGAPLIQHVARTAAPVASSVFAVGRQQGQYDDLGLLTLADRGEHAGPLSGLDAALHHSSSEWLLLLGCDFIGLQASWLTQLLQARQPQASAVAFRGQLWQPLLALYHTDLRSEVARRLRLEEHALWRLLAEQPTVALPLPADWGKASQVNSPQDLAALDNREACSLAAGKTGS